jgi:glycerol kinase
VYSAIDQGTTSSRFIVFSEAGDIVASHQIPLPNYFPQPGWQEQNPLEILSSVTDCIEAVAKKVNVRRIFLSCICHDLFYLSASA